MRKIWISEANIGILGGYWGFGWKVALAPKLLISPLGELRGVGQRDITTATVITNEFTVQVKIMPTSMRVIKLQLRHCSVYGFVIVMAPMVMSSHLCHHHHHPHCSHSCRGSEGFEGEVWQNSSNFAFLGVNFCGLAQYEVTWQPCAEQTQPTTAWHTPPKCCTYNTLQCHKTHETYKTQLHTFPPLTPTHRIPGSLEENTKILKSNL